MGHKIPPLNGETADTWNGMSLKKRKELLRQLGFNPNHYSARTFEFIPSWVRVDIEYGLRRRAKCLQLELLGA